jgi:hypothetical protein
LALQIKDVSQESWQSNAKHRTSGLSKKKLFERDGEGRSFTFHLARYDGPFKSPRHMHNFDQVRIGLLGQNETGVEKMGPRTIGYFPEGTPYGPAAVKSPPSIQLTMQFDGNSRCGYLAPTSLNRGTEELRQLGTFEGGFYTPNGDDRGRIDAYQAAWERIRQRPMVYPPERFSAPVYMNIDSFAWSRGDEPGVEYKSIAQFGEHGTSVEMSRLSSESTAAFSSWGRTTLLFVLSGTVSCNDTSLGEWSAILLEEDDKCIVGGVAASSEIVAIGLPMFG